MDEALYDEFGNYIGPELSDDSDGSDSDAGSDAGSDAEGAAGGEAPMSCDPIVDQRTQKQKSPNFPMFRDFLACAHRDARL